MQYISINNHGKARNIAYCHDQPKNAKAAILWLSGYCSVMNSTKADAIAQWAAEESIEMMRFDYSGLGYSEGEFATANLSDWLSEAVAIYELIQHRSVVIVGSSMGAWLALRLTEYLTQTQHSPLPKSLLLLAPAVDFTHEVLLKKLPDVLIEQLQQNNVIALPSQYDLESLVFHRQMVEDAKNHLLFDHPSLINCPITIIHGEQDQDIPVALGKKAAAHFSVQQLLTIPDGEHRLSREQDIQLILDTLQKLI